MSKRERIIFEIMIFFLGLFAGVALSCAAYIGTADAEEGIMGRCWVMCSPKTEDGRQNEILIRERPGRKANVVGTVVGGDRLTTDWQEKDGWIHVVDLASEAGEGWIFEGYVVFAEPRRVDGEMTICRGGRVACRKWIDGKRKAWAKPGETVTVYWKTGEWAVTDRGYIQSMFLEEGAGE